MLKTSRWAETRRPKLSKRSETRPLKTPQTKTPKTKTPKIEAPKTRRSTTKKSKKVQNGDVLSKERAWSTEYYRTFRYLKIGVK